MSAAVSPGWAPPCVVIADRSASVIQAIATRLGDGSVRVVGARTALEAIRHIHDQPTIALLIGSPAGTPDGDALAHLVADRFPAVSIDRLPSEVPVPTGRLD